MLLIPGIGDIVGGSVDVYKSLACSQLTHVCAVPANNTGTGLCFDRNRGPCVSELQADSSIASRYVSTEQAPAGLIGVS
jgi:hypothetical protein